MAELMLTKQCPDCGEPGDNIVDDDELYFICTNCGLVDPYDLVVKEK